jgi:hypothetical protein
MNTTGVCVFDLTIMIDWSIKPEILPRGRGT